MNKILKILIKILIFFAITLIYTNNNVYAASTKLQANKTTVNVGDEVTVTATVTAAQWDLKIKLNGAVLATSSELDNYESNITKTLSAKYKATAKGTLEFILEGEITDVDQKNSNINEKIQVTVNEKTVDTTTSTTAPTTTLTEQLKSSDASLKNLGIKPNDFKGFKSNITEYSVEVPNNVSTVNVYATPAKGATVKGTGNVSLKEGENTVKITVTSEDGKNTKTYTLKINRKTASEETLTGEARLKSLGIKPKEYDFTGFNSDKTEYSVKVPSDVRELEIYATAIDEKAQINGIGMVTLDNKEKDINIEVIAQNGTKKTYTIKVVREDTNGETDIIEKLGLTKLEINGLTLSPDFEIDTYEYSAELEEDINSLEIDTETSDKDATVEIIGNENLQEGENIITILVTDKEKKEVVTYQIIVNKKAVEQLVQTSWLKPSTWGKEEKIKIAIIIVLIILIICAIILKIKIGKENPKKKKRDFPGSDELDKAIAEHQELSAEEIPEEKVQENEMPETNELEDNSKEENLKNYLEDIAKARLSEEDVKYEIEEKNKRKGKGRHF